MCQGAAIASALGGQAAAIIAWLVSTHVLYGEVTITTTALSGPSLAGNLVRTHHKTVKILAWIYLHRYKYVQACHLDGQTCIILIAH